MRPPQGHPDAAQGCLGAPTAGKEAMRRHRDEGNSTGDNAGLMAVKTMQCGRKRCGNEGKYGHLEKIYEHWGGECLWENAFVEIENAMPLEKSDGIKAQLNNSRIAVPA